jgi:hypothetical protein
MAETRRLRPAAAGLAPRALVPSLHRFFDGDARPSSTVVGDRRGGHLCIIAPLLAPWVAPHNPFDLAS